MFNDRQPKTGATLLARPGLIDPVKPLKYPLERFRRYSRAIILDGDLDLSWTRLPRAQDDFSLTASILDRVIDQVAEHLFKPVGIGSNSKVRHLIHQIDLFG